MSGTFQGRIAFANIDFIAGPSASIASQSGDFASIAYDALGTVTLTLSSPIDPSEAIYLGNTRSTLAGCVNFVAVTDTTIQVFIDDFTGTGANYDCNIAILVKPLV